MSITGLWGNSPYWQYSLDRQGVKSQNDLFAKSYNPTPITDVGKSSPAKIADSEIVASKTVSNSATASTLWETQSFAQSPESNALEAEIDNKPKSITERFLDEMNKSPEELMREAILKELGYTEEDIAAMDPKERAKVEAEIQERIEIKIEEAMREKGIDIDSANSQAQLSDAV